MIQKPVKISRPIPAFLLGLVGVLAVLVCHLAGLDRRAELHGLDLRLRYASNAPPSRDIVHVDIDDGSLAELGRWPWPRERLAGIIYVLTQCGARTVVLDIIMPEPQKVRYVSAAGEIYGGDESVYFGDAPPVPVFDDAVLAGAISRGASVFLPMHIDFARYSKPLLQGRVEKALASDLTLTAAQVARRLNRAEKDVETVLARARKNAVNARVKAILTRAPTAHLSAVIQAVLPDLASHKTSEERDLVQKAYLRYRAINALERFSVPDARVKELPIRFGPTVPPLVTLAQTAKGSGFVTVEPDEDGVVRRIPLLGRSDGRLYPQLAFALAGYELARSHSGMFTLSADASSVTIHLPNGLGRRLPVDEDGFLLIHWARGSWLNANTRHGSRHIPAAAVAAVWEEERKLNKIDDLRHGLCVKFLKLGRALPSGELETLYWEFMDQTGKLDQAYQERLAAERRALKDALYRPSQAHDAQALDEPRRKENEIDARVRAAAEKLVAELRKAGRLELFLAKPAGAAPASPKTPASKSAPDVNSAQAARQYRQAMESYRKVSVQARQTLDLIDGLPAERERIEAGLGKLTRELQPLVAGKICMIGSTATGAADFVPTPLSGRTPGVVVNANIANTILSGAFIRQFPHAAALVIILAIGALVCAIAATRPVVQAGTLSALVAVGYVAFNVLVVFGLWKVWLVVVAPLAAILAGFLLVTAYRQLTEERAKRRIRDMFAHALSPVLVDRLFEDPSLAELGGHNRTLSCLFSDLAGFTALSERLGPDGTVRVLNQYFDCSTEVIQSRWGGYLNKYLGDGIFAFFGAPVHQEDHATRAVQAAVDCQQALASLNESLAAEFGGVRLSMRVGITTGEAMVGNCGSTQRMDYTAIGECVNLASRLESANKYFGTRILVADRAWRACGHDNLLARPLGEVIIVGIREPVRIWEVLGNADDAGPELRRAYADFARGMELFVARQFAAARELFEKTRASANGDGPARIYRDLCDELAARSPAADWPGKDVNSDGITRIVCTWKPTPAS